MSAAPLKSCKVCRGYFPALSSLQQTCKDVVCVREWRRQQERKKALKQARLAKREYRARTKSIGKALQETQREFNRWIRERDWGLGCISCGTTVGKVNAGHYRPAGANAALRFDGANVHRQCERCNTYLSGNLIAYRQGLIAKIGLEAVERLEGPQPPVKWTRDELAVIRREYLARWKALKQRRLECVS